jgi:hypothetical protein
VDLELPAVGQADAERALVEILRVLCDSVFDGLTSDALQMLREQCITNRNPTPSEREMLKMIEVRLARLYGTRSSAPNRK